MPAKNIYIKITERNWAQKRKAFILHLNVFKSVYKGHERQTVQKEPGKWLIANLMLEKSSGHAKNPSAKRNNAPAI